MTFIYTARAPDFTYRFNWWSQVNGYSSASKRELAPYQNRFNDTNANDDMGSSCKHGNLVLSNLSWLMKVASVINNYIHFAEENMQRQFADIIFPKIYGKTYPDAVQLGLFDRKYLAHSRGVIDAINQYGSTRGRFKPLPKEEEPVEVEQDPKQISIFDDETKEFEQEVALDRGEVKDSQGNRGFKKSTIYDYGVEKEEEKPIEKKGFKPRDSQPTINKGFKKISIFDEEEEEN